MEVSGCDTEPSRGEGDTNQTSIQWIQYQICAGSATGRGALAVVAIIEWGGRCVTG